MYKIITSVSHLFLIKENAKKKSKDSDQLKIRASNIY